MAAAMATLATLNAKCLSQTKTQIPISTTKLTHSSPKPISPISIPNLLPKSLTLTASSALAGAVFSTLGSSDPAFAAQQLAQLAETTGSDNRGIALLLPLIPAIAWVLFNILQPALNQINRMRSKGLVVGLGLGGGLAAAGMAGAPEASAAVEEIGRIAAAAEGSDSRGQLLLIVVAPAILWVLYNILQPALNQLNRMRSD
ncbi:unnamed protein product [Linum tenue]|uniref:Photosystem II core complex proteins psbY, chloroplastic n=2 Tax=Linum tenue TaxID=586396 RepID=A0AAV0KVQ2_9ROSI|nr:unnamed protein product [Linum tenue]